VQSAVLPSPSLTVLGVDLPSISTLPTSPKSNLSVPPRPELAPMALPIWVMICCTCAELMAFLPALGERAQLSICQPSRQCMGGLGAYRARAKSGISGAMTTAQDEDAPALATTAPSPVQTRDLLGNFCFYLHFAVMIYIVLGWAVPLRPALVFYLVFLPAVAVQWQFNKNSCVLNNLESLMRSGIWRDPHNREEGAWLLTLARRALGVAVTPLQIDIFTYAVLAGLWGLALWHVLGW
jgi:hypothetical protein